MKDTTVVEDWIFNENYFNVKNDWYVYNIEEFVLVQDFDGRIRSCQMHHLTIVKYHDKMQEKESKFTLDIEYMSNHRERDAQLNIQIYQT